MGHWQNGSTRAWRKVRAQVLAEKGTACHLAFEPWGDEPHQRCAGHATEVHHTQDRDVVGDDPRFLVPACRPCNLHAGDPTQQDPEPNAEW